MRIPQPDPVQLLRWSDLSPWRWLALLAVASPWMRIVLGPVTLYPLHILLTLLLAWALIGVGWRRLAEEVPLFPAVLLIGWLALVTLFRFQWWALGGTLLGGAFLWIWGWAASAVGRQAGALRHFAEAALLFLVTTLVVGVAAWALQWWAPDVCHFLNCDPRTGLPYVFRGGWHSNAQYALVLILLLPFTVEPLVGMWRDPRAGRARIAMILLTIAAGLALLAGARGWLLLVVILGEWLFARVLAADRHPLDRLLLRGMVVFTVFGAIALYGLAPGYLGPLLNNRGDSRAAGVVPPPGTSGVVLASDRVTLVPIKLVNTGWSDLRAGDTRPLQMSALLLFTPRTGQTRAYPGGDLLVYQSIAPGDGLDISVPVRLPHWVNTGFVMWQLRDAAGAAIPITEGSKGFRFANASYYSLDQTGDNQLTALSARARAFVTRAMLPPRDATSLTSDSLAGNAFDTIFFSPLWGQRSNEDPGDGPLNTSQSMWLQLLHSYGLVGIGLAAWFYVRLLRQSLGLSGGGGRFGGRLAWRMVPVSVILLGAFAMLSGDPARYHSLWGCFLLAGFVEGAHGRTHPNRPSLRFGIPDPRRWRAMLSRLAAARPRSGMWRGPSGPSGMRLPSIRLPGMRLPAVRLPRMGVPRIRLPGIRFPRRRARSPLYPQGGGRRWRLPLPKLRIPRWRRSGNRPPTRRR